MCSSWLCWTAIPLVPHVTLNGFKENASHSYLFVNLFFLSKKLISHTVGCRADGIVGLLGWASSLVSLSRFVAKVTESDQWPFHYVASYYKASFSQGHYGNVPTLIEDKPSVPTHCAAGGSHSHPCKQLFNSSHRVCAGGLCPGYALYLSAIMRALVVITMIRLHRSSVSPLQQWSPAGESGIVLTGRFTQGLCAYLSFICRQLPSAVYEAPIKEIIISHFYFG